MLQVDEDLQAARDYVMGSTASDIDDEPDAARVVLEGWIVEPASRQGVAVLLRHVAVMADT